MYQQQPPPNYQQQQQYPNYPPQGYPSQQGHYPPQQQYPPQQYQQYPNQHYPPQGYMPQQQYPPQQQSSIPQDTPVQKGPVVQKVKIPEETVKNEETSKLDEVKPKPENPEGWGEGQPSQQQQPYMPPHNPYYPPQNQTQQQQPYPPQQQYSTAPHPYAPSQQSDIENLQRNLLFEIQKLVAFLSEPNSTKLLSNILRETCDKIKKGITYQYEQDHYDKTQMTCFTFIDNQMYGQGQGKSKKDSRNDSARVATEKLLIENKEALDIFQHECGKEIERRQKLGPVAPVNQNSQQPQNSQIQQQQQQPHSTAQANNSENLVNIQENHQSTAACFPEYIQARNYKEDLNNYAHKQLHQTIKYQQSQQDQGWVVICGISTLTMKGFANNVKEAKNLAAYRILLKAKEMEAQQPGILAQIPKEKKNNSKKRSHKEQAQINGQYESEQIVERQEKKKIRVNPDEIWQNENENNSNIINGQQEQQQQEVKQPNLTDILDSRFIDYNEYDNPHSEKEAILQNHLKSILKNVTASEQQIQQAESLLKDVQKLEPEMKQLGVLSLITMGSFVNKTLLKQKIVVDVAVNFFIGSEVGQEKLQQDYFIPVYQLLDSALPKPFPEGVNMQEKCQQYQIQNQGKSYFQSNQRAFLKNTCILVHSLENPDVILNIFPNFMQQKTNEKYPSNIHNLIWMNKFTPLEDLQNLQSAMKIFRAFKLTNNLKISVEILDIILFLVSYKFKQINLVRVVDDFMQFVANDGLQNLIEKNDQHLYELNQFQFKLLNKAFESPNKPVTEQFIKLCKQIVSENKIFNYLTVPTSIFNVNQLT